VNKLIKIGKISAII